MSVRQVASYKYLGLIMDNRLSWEVHVDNLCRRVATKDVLFKEAQIIWGGPKGQVVVLSCLY